MNPFKKRGKPAPAFDPKKLVAMMEEVYDYPDKPPERTPFLDMLLKAESANAEPYGVAHEVAREGFYDQHGRPIAEEDAVKIQAAYMPGIADAFPGGWAVNTLYTGKDEPYKTEPRPFCTTVHRPTGILVTVQSRTLDDAKQVHKIFHDHLMSRREISAIQMDALMDEVRRI